MALPTNVGFGTVTGRFIDSNGTSIEGSVTFTPSPKRLINASAEPTPVTILPKPVTVTLDGGAFTQALVATDDGDNNPHNWTYHVAFKFTGASADSFSIEVPEGATVDLTTVAPVSSSNGATIIRGPGVPDWENAEDGQVVVLVDGVPAWGDQSGGGGGVSSWNDLTDKPSTFPPTIGSTSDTALAGNTAFVPPTRTVAGKALSSNVTLAKADVGLGNVDNTADSAKSFTASQVASGTLDAARVPNLAASKINSGTFDVARLPAGSTLSVVYDGSAWPARPTARTDVIVQWIDYTGTAPVPSGGVADLDIVIQDAGV